MTRITSKRTLGKKSLPETVLERRFVLGRFQRFVSQSSETDGKNYEVNGVARVISN